MEIFGHAVEHWNMQQLFTDFLSFRGSDARALKGDFGTDEPEHLWLGASRCVLSTVQSALLTPRVTPGSLDRCGKSILRAACALRLEGRGLNSAPKHHRPVVESARAWGGQVPRRANLRLLPAAREQLGC